MGFILPILFDVRTFERSFKLIREKVYIRNLRYSFNFVILILSFDIYVYDKMLKEACKEISFGYSILKRSKKIDRNGDTMFNDVRLRT